jgi:hypothetical protein
MHLGKFDPLPDRRFSAGVRDYRERGQSLDEYFIAIRLPRGVLYCGLSRGFRMESRNA